jgi:hypothetical protein
MGFWAVIGDRTEFVAGGCGVFSVSEKMLYLCPVIPVPRDGVCKGRGGLVLYI